MADDEQKQSEPAFRSNKRRKVFRKRADSDEDGHEEGRLALQEPKQTSIDVNDQSATPGAKGIADRSRKPKKHGIVFSSSGTLARQAHDEHSVLDLTPEGSSAAPQPSQVTLEQNGRFTKPTGKVVVTDDRHMYVINTAINIAISNRAALTA